MIYLYICRKWVFSVARSVSPTKYSNPPTPLPHPTVTLSLLPTPSIQHYPSLRTIPLPFNERSVGFASLRNSGRSTSGIHARPRKRGEVLSPAKFGRLSEGIVPRLHHQSTCHAFFPTHCTNLAITTVLANPVLSLIFPLTPIFKFGTVGALHNYSLFIFHSSSFPFHDPCQSRTILKTSKLNQCH